MNVGTEDRESRPIGLALKKIRTDHNSDGATGAYDLSWSLVQTLPPHGQKRDGPQINSSSMDSGDTPEFTSACGLNVLYTAVQ